MKNTAETVQYYGLDMKVVWSGRLMGRRSAAAQQGWNVKTY
jgi:hypothetical protein